MDLEYRFGLAGRVLQSCRVPGIAVFSRPLSEYLLRLRCCLSFLSFPDLILLPRMVESPSSLVVNLVVLWVFHQALQAPGLLTCQINSQVGAFLKALEVFRCIIPITESDLIHNLLNGV